MHFLFSFVDAVYQHIYPSNSLNFTHFFLIYLLTLFLPWSVYHGCAYVLYPNSRRFTPQTLLHSHAAINSNLMKKTHTRNKLKLQTIIYSEYNPFHCIIKCFFLLSFVCSLHTRLDLWSYLSVSFSIRMAINHFVRCISSCEPRFDTCVMLDATLWRCKFSPPSFVLSLLFSKCDCDCASNMHLLYALCKFLIVALNYHRRGLFYEFPSMQLAHVYFAALLSFNFHPAIL